MHSNSFSVKQNEVGCSLSLLGIHRIEKFHQTPILDDSLGHGNLTIGRGLHRGEQLPKVRHVPEIGRQVVHEQGFGMEAAEGNVRRIQPITVQFVYFLRSAGRNCSAV